MIKYLGSKRLLLTRIIEVIRRLGPVESVLDLFSGTSRVGHGLKRAGFRVISNDVNLYAATLARCYVEADLDDVLEEAQQLVTEFNRTRGSPGYFTETFCLKSRFFQPRNGERIDAIRELIASKGLRPELEAVMLVSLMEAADRVDSTTGVQMAYLKSWAPRANNPLVLRIPDVLPRSKFGKGQASNLDALMAVRELQADVAYIDPPYNQHSYLGNYHIWESLVRWDKPDFYGVACKRVDCRERQSIFNSRPRFAGAMIEMLSNVQASTLVVSFSDEGFLSRAEIEGMLGHLWEGTARVTVIEKDFKRYVGAQIGIYNPDGLRVGKVSHLRNTERLYIASRSHSQLELDSLTDTAARQSSLFV
ncbi:MAG: DNA adenine methylase [Planctomycetota bacterium]